MAINSTPMLFQPGAREGYLVTLLGFLKDHVNRRLAIHFGREQETIHRLARPDERDHSALAKFVRHYKPSDPEMLILGIAAAPHVAPGFFDNIIQQFLPQGGELPELGGVKGEHHRGMLPTGETALFILAGSDPGERLATLPLFDESRFLFKHRILTLETVKRGEPRLSGRLMLESEFAEVFTTGEVALPKLSIHFPAEHLTTAMEWSDLVLNESTWQQIQELEIWIRHNATLMSKWGMDKKLKPGYRVLFYGPPGTGKTLTAALLAKQTARDLFRIDLSMVVSKYIGETEKSLAALFDKAADKDWILFFDEADAIFGKRTGVRDAHDKYANQEVSYLLQRIELHPGLVILASNFKNNIDSAFLRRFNSIVYFPAPSEDERLALWEKSFPKTVQLDKDVDLAALAGAYELTGSHIINIVQHVCLCALEKETTRVSRDEVLRGIKRELEKGG